MSVSILILYPAFDTQYNLLHGTYNGRLVLIYLSRYLDQETAKRSFNHRVKLSPVTTSLTTQR